MASISASSVQKSFKYDVFLSFRGEDTRKTFVDHLYHALTQKGIITYKDDEEIKKGERITDELIRSIKDSKFYIIVFSKNYASSSWCLEELVKIMECQETNEHTAYPVFYDVEPTEVRKQSGAVEEAFSKHKEKEAAEKWREALREAADLAGWELKKTFDGHEAKLIQKIVKEISLGLRFSNLSVDGKLVGMETRVEDVVKSLEINVEDVRMIGIWGMGGAGKTTLARAVFDQLSYRFEGSSFVENVRENSKIQLGGLKSLQKQVLSEVLDKKHITIKGIPDLKKMMSSRKVLVVLDDVDHLDQLEALAGEPNWFKLGSRVIITTREEQVLVAHGVPENLILRVKLFSDEEASCLFNKYAFGGLIPNQGYKELASQVVHYAAGLPLTIKVLGSDLRGKDEIVWKDALKRLKTIPLKATMEKLELSYKSLEEDYKEIFLDVACMLKGWRIEKAIRALESRGFNAIIGLNVLEKKTLITISDSGYLRMHDHIEEMGKNIVRRLHLNKPYRHSRLWIEEETEDILVEENGTEETQCIEVRKVDPIIVMKGLRKMKELKFLNVICGREVAALNYISKFLPFYLDGADLDYKDSMYLPNGLQYLSWEGYPFSSLPKNFKANHLVGLDMRMSNIDQLWEGGEKKVPKKIRFIDLWRCNLRTLDVGLLMNLERLNLEMCKNLVELDMGGEKPKLKYLSLEYTKLKTLNLKGTRYLESLNLKCQNLVELHMPIEFFKLKSFNLSQSKLRALDIGPARNFHTLNFNSNRDLLELHLPVKNVKHLRLSTNKHKSVHEQLERFGDFKKLIYPSLSSNRYCGLEQSEQHDDLLELHMPIESPELKIIYLCSEMRNPNLTATMNHGKLGFVQCEDLLELHNPIESPELRIIYIRCRMRCLNLMLTCNLDSLVLLQSNLLQELHLPIEFPELRIINIHCFELKTLNLTGAWNLEKLELVCEDLIELHMPIVSPKLKTIHVGGSKLKTLNLTGAGNLEKLDLLKCQDLLELHLPVESLKHLRLACSTLKTLNLTGAGNLKMCDLQKCQDLLELHLPIESLKHLQLACSTLKILNLTGAGNLEMCDLLECQDLLELHLPVESLKHLGLACSKLGTLKLIRAGNLERLDLIGQDLPEFHLPIENLRHLQLTCFKWGTLNLTGVGNLERLELVECQDLLELLMPNESPKLKIIHVQRSKLRTLNITGARNLETLNLVECQDLLELLMPIESPKLKSIDVWHSKLRTLNITGARNLEWLDLEECEDLLELLMPIESLKLKRIHLQHSKLRTLYPGLSPCLGRLDLDDCFNLVEVKAPIGCGCVRFKPLLVDQGFPMIGSSAELHLIVRPVGICPLHIDNNSPKFHFECNYKELLPPLSRNLEKLISFGHCACTNLAGLSGSICGLQSLRKLTLEGSITEVPKELDQLECLEELTLLKTDIEHLPGSICTLKNLKFLQVESCRFLKQLPEDLDRLQCLEELHLKDCKSLLNIPNSICEMTRLKCFHLIRCIRVMKLPREIGRLPCLKDTYIEGTGIIDPPESLFQLKGEVRFFT